MLLGVHSVDLSVSYLYPAYKSPFRQSENNIHYEEHFDTQTQQSAQSASSAIIRDSDS